MSFLLYNSTAIIIGEFSGVTRTFKDKVFNYYNPEVTKGIVIFEDMNVLLDNIDFNFLNYILIDGEFINQDVNYFLKKLESNSSRDRIKVIVKLPQKNFNKYNCSLSYALKCSDLLIGCIRSYSISFNTNNDIETISLVNTLNKTVIMLVTASLFILRGGVMDIFPLFTVKDDDSIEKSSFIEMYAIILLSSLQVKKSVNNALIGAYIDIRLIINKQL